jgi:hypothetical protein
MRGQGKPFGRGNQFAGTIVPPRERRSTPRRCGRHLPGSPWQPVSPVPASASKTSKVATPAVKPPADTSAALKLRQTQAEYVAARPAGEPGVKPMMSSSKMYVCRRCQANFKTGDGKPDSRLPGWASATSASPPRRPRPWPPDEPLRPLQGPPAPAARHALAADVTSSP